MAEIRTDRLPLTIDPEVLIRITQAKSPVAAVGVFESYSVDVAVSIIDNLDLLTAALIFATLRLQVLYGDVLKYCNVEKARLIVEKGDKLRIRGSMGLIHARDQVFRETGYFAGI